MSLLEAYQFLIADSFIAAIVLPIHDPYVFAVMLEFDPYHGGIMIGCAVVGSIVAGLFNWGLGRMLISARKGLIFEEESDLLDNQFFKLLNQYKYWLLIGASIPVFGAVVTVLNGLLRAKLHITLILVAASYVVYYVIWQLTGVALGF